MYVIVVRRFCVSQEMSSSLHPIIKKNQSKSVWCRYKRRYSFFSSSAASKAFATDASNFPSDADLELKRPVLGGVFLGRPLQ